MSIKSYKIIPGALVVLGILVGFLSFQVACYASGAVMIVPVEDENVPKGSQIPEWRMKETEKKVGEYKMKMKGVSSKEKQESMPKEELPNSDKTEAGD